MYIESKEGRKLLIHLALNGPDIGNRIDGLSNPSRTARELEEKELITGKMGVHDIQEHTRPSKLLKLTTLGLVHAIIYLSKDREVTAEDFSRIAEHWSEYFPLVLGKWDFFVQEGVADWVSNQFQQVSLSELILMAGYLDSYEGRLEALKKGGLMSIYAWAERELGKELQDTITKLVYELGIGKTPKSQAFLDTCMKEPEIRDYLESLAEETTQHGKALMQRGINAKKSIEGKDKK
jgi:hypothetical protein